MLADALGAVAKGDRDALRRVYAMTSAKLFGICFRICGERTSAEDVLQTVYVKVWDRAGQFDPSLASPITWLGTIARNAAIDWRRSAAGRAALSKILPETAAAAIADDSASAEELLVTADENERLYQCLDALETRTRTCIRAAFFGGETYLELASREAVPLSTMKSWIRRGLIRLKDCLGDG